MELQLISLVKLLCLYLCLQTVFSSDKIVFPDDEAPDLMKVLDTEKIENRNFFFNSHRDVCLQVTGEPGDCVPLGACEPLQQFVDQNGLHNHHTVQFLRSRICRLFRNSVNLCCPQTSAPPPPNVFPPPNAFRPPTSGLNSGGSLPSMSECGFTTAVKIVGGSAVPPGAHPWLVGLGAPSSNPAFRVLCGGTLISRKHVLTAAHCFVRQPNLPEVTHVILGEHNLAQNNEQTLILRIAKRINPGYDSTTQANDIELVTLEREVNFGSFIRPACMPTKFQRRNLEGSTMTIVGWGKTMFRAVSGSEVPLAANIRITPKDECRAKYASHPEIPLDNKQICAATFGVDACQGDSGGPLIYQDNQQRGKYFLMGIVSFGIECANPNFPGVYTFVPEFRDWINQNL